MEYTIKTLSSKRRNITEKESEIIKRALPSYQVVLGQYEKYTDEMKRKDLEKLNKENANNLSSLNPFDVDMSEDKTYEPTLEDTKTFVYSAWAEAVANVQTPFVCASSVKKGIRKQAFRDVQKGKYLNKKVKDIMNDFILKLSGNVKVENKNEEK
jgi:hypothetical protein